MASRASNSLAYSFVVGLCALAWACTSTTTIVAANGDAGGVDTSAEEADAEVAPSDAGATPDSAQHPSAPLLACANAVTGSLISVDTISLGHLPTPTGGAVADGHYVLVAATVMSSGPFPDRASDLWIANGRYEYETKNSDGIKNSYGGTIKFSGPRITVTVDCGLLTPFSWQYSVSGSELTTQFTNTNGFSWLYTFQRVD
jgi:hypothetical protein